MAYLYKIENKINHKFYIGHTTNISKRFNSHKSYLRNNRHHSIYLQRAWNKYGEENFDFLIIKECSLKESIELEQYYIDSFQGVIYNTGKLATFGGDLISNHPRNKEIREERKITQLNFISSLTENERKEKYGQKGVKNGMFGKTHSIEVRQKLSDRNKKYIGEKNPFYGKEHSLETKKKMSECAKKRTGKNNPFYGKQHSEETKEKIKKANTGKKPVNRKKVLIINGIVFDSVTSASKHFNVVPATIINRIKSSNKLYENYQYIDV